MHVLILLFAPALFWAAYHYYHDRHKPEPLHYVFLTYVLGIGAGYLGTFGYQGLAYIGLDYDVFSDQIHHRDGSRFSEGAFHLGYRDCDGVFSPMGIWQQLHPHRIDGRMG